MIATSCSSLPSSAATSFVPLSSLSGALAAVRERWEPETMARNLRLIREARESRAEDQTWVRSIESALLVQAASR